MKKQYALGTMFIAAAIMLAGSILYAAPPVSRPHPRPTVSLAAPPDANVYGKTLTEWLNAYWVWNYTSDTSMPYQPGPAPLVFMPMPSGNYVSGAGTADDPAIYKGEKEVTLRPGTAFVVPFFAWIAERYDPSTGLPDDLFISDDAITDTILDPVVTLDGVPLMNNFFDYYVGPDMFDPPIPYDPPTSYGAVAAIGFQGVGVIVRPLPPGQHVLHLTEEMSLTQENLPTLPEGVTLGQVYDNTWIINVVPPGQANPRGPNGPKGPKGPKGLK